MSRYGTSRSYIDRPLRCPAIGGPSLEMPLHALELAFGPRMDDGTNAGFLRDDALLAMVVLTDEDDCSRTDDNFTIANEDEGCDENNGAIVPRSHYLELFDELKQGRGRWAMAVIAGPGPGSCNSGFGSAIEADRLAAFVGDVGTNGVFSSICEGDLTPALQDALATFSAACEAFPPVE